MPIEMTPNKNEPRRCVCGSIVEPEDCEQVYPAEGRVPETGLGTVIFHECCSCGRSQFFYVTKRAVWRRAI